MENRDLFWLVGFLEGEGSFGFNRTPAVRAFQSGSPETLECCRAIAGGKVLGPYPRVRGKPRYVWGLQGDVALHLMQELLPYMSARRQEQIRTALAASEARVTWTEERRAKKAEMARRVLVPYSRGRVVSAETRQKVREATKRWWASASLEKRARRLANLTGGEQTEARRKNLSVAIQRAWAEGKFGSLPGPKVEHAKEGSPEAREKRRRARLGKTNSPEHRAKISAALIVLYKKRKSRATVEDTGRTAEEAG